MSDSPDVGYGLVLSFAGLYPTMPEEHAFVHGVELGKLYEQMTAGLVAEIETVTHAENREIIARAAASLGWELECTPSEVAGWDLTKLAKTRVSRPNPHGLRVAKG